MTICTPDNQDQPFVSFLGIPWFTYQGQFDLQIHLAITRQADVGASLDFWITKSHDDTCPPVMPHFLSGLDRKSRSMDRKSRSMLLPSASEMTKLVKHEQEYRSNPHSMSPWEILNVRTGVEIVQVMIFMSSNNLSTCHDMYHFLKSVIHRDMRWALKTMLSPKSPTAEIFATELLRSACRADDSETIRLLLSVRADPNTGSRYMKSPLFWAVRNGCTSTVKLLIEAGAEVDPFEDYLGTAMSLSNPIEMVGLLLKAGATVQYPVLHSAVRSDNIELVEMILDAGACDPQWETIQCEGEVEVRRPCTTALQLAAKNNNLDMVCRLSTNRDVNFPTTFSFEQGNGTTKLIQHCGSPLVYAVRNGNVKMIEALLDAGADIIFVPGLESKQTMWNLAIKYARKFERKWETRRYLLQITDTALQTAVYQENLELVQFLLAAGASADTYHYGDTALQIAAKRNNVPLVRILLAHGADVHASAHWPFGRTALQAASENGNLSMIDQLLGAMPESSWSKNLNMPPSPIGGRTALQAAAENGHMSMVKYLLQLDANINGPTAYVHGATVVQAAVRSGNLNLTKLVLAAGAETGTSSGTDSALVIAIDQHDLSMFELICIHATRFCSVPNKDQRPILQRAAEQESSIFLEILLQAGWNVNEIWRHGHPDAAIGSAVQRGRIANVELLLHAGANPQRALVNDVKCMDSELLTLLLGHGADPNGVGEKPYNFTPFARAASHHIRAKEDKLPTIRILLNAGAVVDCRDLYEPMSILATAVQYEDVGLCKLLLAAGADPNWRYNTSDVTALEVAAYGGSDEIFYLLVDAGADVNPTSPNNRMTALQRAVLFQNLDFVRTLLQHGAYVNAPPGHLGLYERSRGEDDDRFKDFNWKATALQAACFGDNEEIIDVLLGAGADINALASSYAGRIALQAAASIGDLDRVRMLQQKGADINAPACEDTGVTALQAASIGGHLAVVVFLLHEGVDINSAKSPINGRTALEGAAEHGRLDVVHLLLENDHNMEGFYDRCEDAAVFAEGQGHKVIARILRNYRKD